MAGKEQEAMKRGLNIWLPVLALLLAVSCKPAIAPTITPTSGPVIEGQRPVKQAWEEEWRKTLSAARQEGKLLVYTNDPPTVRSFLLKVMREKYGLEVEFVTGTAVEFTQKLLAEQRAGLYYGDVFIGAAGPAIANLLPGSAFDPLKPELLLPEALDTRHWYGNKLPFLSEKWEQILWLRGDPRRPVAINTDLVKPEEIVSYQNLLNPKFKGKIIMGDPTVLGAPQATVFGVAEYIMGWDFMKELAKQDPFIIRDKRLIVDWLARGKHDIAFGAASDMVAEFQKAGAPLLEIIPKEGSVIEAGVRVIGVLNKRPHPNAARVFVNWFLTKEGQSLYAEATGYQSLREDASTAHLDPRLVRKPGDKVAGEEFETMRDKNVPTIKGIFAPLMK